MHSLEWHTFNAAPELDIALARLVAHQLDKAIKTRGRASLAVSGGRTPANFLRALGSMPIDWSRISITLADERWVPIEHSDSNARLVKETLLASDAAAAHFVPLFNDAQDAHTGQVKTECSLQALAWPLDVLILGMGDDCHTASLFPQAPELGTAYTTTDRCIAITPVTAAHTRMSLSLAALSSARTVIVHITGSNKRQLLESALTASAPALPIRRVLDATEQAHIFWAP